MHIYLYMITACTICSKEFAKWELQNPRYCCSLQQCQSCYTSNTSCPQCGSGDRVSELRVLFQSDQFQITKTKDGVVFKWLQQDGRLHRDEDLPSWIKYNKEGQILYERWYQDGHQHRDHDRPAEIKYIYTYGNKQGWKQTEEWYQNGKKHRNGDLPAVIQYNTEGQIEYVEWRRDGLQHRDGDMPAEIYYDEGQKEFEYTESELE